VERTCFAKKKRIGLLANQKNFLEQLEEQLLLASRLSLSMQLPPLISSEREKNLATTKFGGKSF